MDTKIPPCFTFQPIDIIAAITCCAIETDKWTCPSISGYEIFAFKKPSRRFIWEGLLTAGGMGKSGLVSDIDSGGNGYFISFSGQNSLLQIRAWGFNPKAMRQNFILNELQFGVFKMNEENTFYFRLDHYGNYIELSMDGRKSLL